MLRAGLGIIGYHFGDLFRRPDRNFRLTEAIRIFTPAVQDAGDARAQLDLIGVAAQAIELRLESR